MRASPLAPSVLIAALLCSGALAGCLGTSGQQASDAPAEDDSRGPSGSPDVPQAAPTSNSPPEGALPPLESDAGVEPEPRNVVFDGCHGLSSVIDFVGDTGPGKPPGNWSPTKGWRNELLLLFYECARITWGPIERGPVRMFWETHTNFAAPVACREGEYSTMAALHALWLDDPGLANYLNRTYGLNTLIANFTPVDDRSNGVQQVRWTWGIPGHPSSTIQYSQAIVTPGPVQNIHRLVWFQGRDTVWSLTLDQTMTYTNGQTALTPGTLQPPTLYAASGTETYWGRGSADLGAILAAEIEKFGDSACRNSL